jgi:hypothetical protein
VSTRSEQLRKIGYSENGDLVHSFRFVIGPLLDIFVDVFEVRDCHVLLKLLVVEQGVVCQLDPI